jgi:hypothetical protein
MIDLSPCPSPKRGGVPELDRSCRVAGRFATPDAAGETGSPFPFREGGGAALSRGRRRGSRAFATVMVFHGRGGGGRAPGALSAAGAGPRGGVRSAAGTAQRTTRVRAEPPTRVAGITLALILLAGCRTMTPPPHPPPPVPGAPARATQ